MLRLIGGNIERHNIARPLVFLATGEGIARAVEDAIKTIIIAGRDRIVLVIVAAGASQGQTQNALAQRVESIVDGQVVVLERIKTETAARC